jgi:hypothetical protein
MPLRVMNTIGSQMTQICTDVFQHRFLFQPTGQREKRKLRAVQLHQSLTGLIRVRQTCF